MTADPSIFQDEYTTALRQYVTEPGEAGLERAYELGRRAVHEELSVLEISAMHHTVMAILLEPSTNQQVAKVAEAMAAFFNESLSAFEMVQRGFGEVQKIATLEKQYADQLRSLAEGSTDIYATFSLEEILLRFAELAPRLVNAEQCMVVTASNEDWSNARLAAAHPQTGITLAPGDLLARLHALASRGEARTFSELPMQGDLLVAVLAGPWVGQGLVIVSGKRTGSFTEQDESVLKQLTQSCSVAIERSQLYKHQSAIAETLQRALLPDKLPAVPGLDIASRYLPGGGGENVGGDWFDVVEMRDGRVGLAIGDVAGHGVHAASEMGQVRTAFRAYVVEHEDPAPVMSRMASLLNGQNSEHFSTMAYLVLSADRQAMQLARAGHLSPLLITSDGNARYVDVGLSPPLGAAPGAAYKQVKVPLSSGDTIILLTDGVLGKKDPDEVLDRIRSGLEGSPAHPEEVCDRVLAIMEQNSHDDVTLLAARLA